MSYACPWCKPDIQHCFGSFIELRLHAEYYHNLWSLSPPPVPNPPLRRLTKYGKPFSQVRRPEMPDYYSHGYLAGRNIDSNVRFMDTVVRPVAVEPVEKSVAIQTSNSPHSISSCLSSLSSDTDEPTSIISKAQREILLKIVDQRDEELQKVKQDLFVANDTWRHLETKIETLNSFLQVNRSAIENLNSLLAENRQIIAQKDQKINTLQSEVRHSIEKEVQHRRKLESTVDNIISHALRAEQMITNAHYPNTSNERFRYTYTNEGTVQSFVDSGPGLRGMTEDTIGAVTTRGQSIQQSPSLYYTAQTPTRDTSRCSMGKKWVQVLPSVLYYLDTAAIFSCARVCSSWRWCSLQSRWWQDVELNNCLVDSKYLSTIATYCQNTESLRFNKLLLPFSPTCETETQREQRTRGILEPGLEVLLKSTSHSVKKVILINCGNMLTERAVWIVSCFCRNLEHLVYISSTNPVSSEVIWSLGAGCQRLRSLVIPPLQPNKKLAFYTNRTLAVIGRCFPYIHTLCVGGAQIDERGLLKITTCCKQLRVLELDHMGEVREQTAVKLCQNGLDQLNVLIFTFTPVTPKALYSFYKHCRSLQSICVRISWRDYFPGRTFSRDDQRKYEDQIRNLMALKTRARLGKILQIEAEVVD